MRYITMADIEAIAGGVTPPKGVKIHGRRTFYWHVSATGASAGIYEEWSREEAVRRAWCSEINRRVHAGATR